MKLNINRIACLSVLFIVVALAGLIQPAQSLLDVRVQVDKEVFNPNDGPVTISYYNEIQVGISSLLVNDELGGNWINAACSNAQGWHTYTWDGVAVPDGTYNIIYNVKKGVEINSASAYVTVNRGTPLPTITPAPTFTPTLTPTYTPTITPTFTPTPTNTPTPTPTPTPKPDTAGKITFASDRDGNYEIYVMNADGTGQTRLTNDPAWDQYPDWSPDGSKIAFASKRDGNVEIYVMNADGTGQTRLTNNPAGGDNPAWSQDGSKIIFESERDGNLEIYVMNADGTGQTRLTNNSSMDFNPAWSPDGSKIVFNSNRDGNYEIYVMNADGTGLTRLTNNQWWGFDSSWSPDGTRIAFNSNRNINHEIYVMNTDGTGQTRLTNNQSRDIGPSWSPDGTRIAFSSDRDGNDEIYVMNTDGTGQTRLTNNSASDQYQDWSGVPAPTPMPNPTSVPTPTPAPIPTPHPVPDNDTAPPVTVIALNGVQGNGADLYTSDVQVVLLANDGTGSGVDWTRYSLDNATWYRYTAPFTVSSEGLNTVYYYSVDKANNIESTRSKAFAVSKQSTLPGYVTLGLLALVLLLLCTGLLAIVAIRRRKGER